MRTKKVYKLIKPSQNLGLGKDRPASGFAYAIIPNDISRQEYLREYYKTGFCMIITDFNEVVRKVKVPNHLLQHIEFPLQSGQYGSLLSWNNVPTSNQIIITGIHRKPNQSLINKEGVYVDSWSIKGKSTISVTTDLNTNTRTVSSKNDDGSSGALVFVSKSQVGTARFALYNNGSALFECDDSVDVVVENKISIQIGTSENKKSTLTIANDGSFEYIDFNKNFIKVNKDEFHIQAPAIKLGQDAQQPAIKGDELVKVLNELITAITQITHISSSPGTPTSPPTNSTAINSIINKLEGLKSTKCKVE